jgi:hypothetical protein
MLSLGKKGYFYLYLCQVFSNLLLHFSRVRDCLWKGNKKENYILRFKKLVHILIFKNLGHILYIAYLQRSNEKYVHIKVTK